MPKPRYQLWAEPIREIGVLFLVFAPLDTLFRVERNRPVDWLIAFGIAMIGLALIFVGVELESEK